MQKKMIIVDQNYYISSRGVMIHHGLLTNTGISNAYQLGSSFL